ncbi:hypothetical protein M011DRAFT_186452 [Sporormia fimetaria CBS 119925]|uniref:C2H2-type domain-containing protein n=1 Tax=Sporormia fimetaria CBS 119925 TaxID=1340428 RepID=A0A6A6VMU1_9PLEO|nr:hypothetical protein M011DRAFT_186452 [Sporormia fimetaria CBS 119925]
MDRTHNPSSVFQTSTLSSTTKAKFRHSTMKTWLHNRKARRYHAELVPVSDRPVDQRPANQLYVHTNAPFNSDYKVATIGPKSIDRLSIERYLSAPLEDEPASVPAINAALQRQSSQRSLQTWTPLRSRHSRESSRDKFSDSKWTNRGPESTRTSYSMSRANLWSHQRSKSPPGNAENRHAEYDRSPVTNLTTTPRPLTSGNIASLSTGPPEQHMPDYEHNRDVEYRLRAKKEIADIQRRASLLEERIRISLAAKDTTQPLSPTMTDQIAYQQMQTKPKLAWILGPEVMEALTIERPQSSGSALSGTAGPLRRHGSSGTLGDQSTAGVLRRARSNSELEQTKRRTAAEQGVGSIPERMPSRRTRFFCTFCLKRFHTKVDWMRHEQTAHMPEELWVCCPRTGEFPDRCPFCAKSHPSPSHLADHNYISCQEKPLSERTFSQQDSFLQHISLVHKVTPGQKPLRMTELLAAWRQTSPLRTDHQALHCGFCGKVFRTYNERTEHVSNHFLRGSDMISWWNERLSHEVPDPKPSEAMRRNLDLPHRCLYCERVYRNLAVAQKLHPLCTMWSCSFLPGMQYTIFPAGSKEKPEAVCCFCNEALVRGASKVKGTVLREHVVQHNFRNCTQRLYFSGQRFRQHLQETHKSRFDGSLFAGWTLLLKSSRRTKPSVFEAVQASGQVKRAYTDPVTTEAANAQRGQLQTPKMNFMDLTETPLRATAPTRKLQRKASAPNMAEKRDREERDATHSLKRAATMDDLSGKIASQTKAGFPAASLPMDAVKPCPLFYRRDVEASTRNILYVRDKLDGPVSKNGQKVFRQVPGSLFGGLVLHSSLVGAVPARMTNSVDIYSLH